MADRVPASIAIGGTLTAADYAELTALATAEGLSTEWGGPRFAPADRTPGAPLRLYAHDVAWGSFDDLEEWCVGKSIPFSRWCGGCAGEWGPERIVFTGEGEPTSFAADEDDDIVVSRQVVEKLGSIEAILAHFDAATIALPPLIIEGEDTPSAA